MKDIQANMINSPDDSQTHSLQAEVIGSCPDNGDRYQRRRYDDDLLTASGLSDWSILVIILNIFDMAYTTVIFYKVGDQVSILWGLLYIAIIVSLCFGIKGILDSSIWMIIPSLAVHVVALKVFILATVFLCFVSILFSYPMGPRDITIGAMGPLGPFISICLAANCMAHFVLIRRGSSRRSAQVIIPVATPVTSNPNKFGQYRDNDDSQMIPDEEGGVVAKKSKPVLINGIELKYDQTSKCWELYRRDLAGYGVFLYV